MTPRLQHAPHLFANVGDAVAALSAYLAEWSGYLAYDIAPVCTGTERAYDGFTVQARKFTGEPVGYIGHEIRQR